MTTTTISGTYSAGYELHAPTTVLSITASGFVGGYGVSVQGAGSYSLINSGTIVAYSATSPDRVAVALPGGGSVTNGSASDISAAIIGQASALVLSYNSTVINFGSIIQTRYNNPNYYSAIFIVSGGTVVNGAIGDNTATIKGAVGVRIYGSAGEVVNYGVIAGKHGSHYYGSVFLEAGGNVTNGAETDVTAQLLGGVNIAIQGTLTNFGTIAGGLSANGLAVSFGDNGAGRVINGSRTDGIALIKGYMALGSGTLTNYGTIFAISSAQEAVVAGAGPETIANFGTIDSYFHRTYASNAGGVDLRAGGEVINGGIGDRSALIVGEVGIRLTGPGTVTNFGTIAGTFGKAVVLYSAADTFVVENYSKTVGAVFGGGGRLDLAAGSGTITSLGATGLGAIATISGAETMTFTGFNAYELMAGSSWRLESGNTLGAQQALTIDGTLAIDGALSSAGMMSISGSVGGAGALVVAGGATSIDAGAAIGVLHWNSDGGITTLNESLAFGGGFLERAGATVSVALGDVLTLKGTTLLFGTLNGAGTVSVANAAMEGLVLGGASVLSVAGSITQAGVVTIGDSGASSATLSILRTGVWNIGGSLARGAARGNSIFNDGLLIKANGLGTSTVGVAMWDNGVVEAATGRLRFTQALLGAGSLRIDAGAGIEVDSSCAKTLSAVFNGPSATLALAQPRRFAATITGFATSDTIDLIRIKATGASINAGNQLVIVNGSATVATLQLAGSYAGATFTVVSDNHAGTDIAIVATAPLSTGYSSPSLLAAAMSGMTSAASTICPGQETARVLAPVLATLSGHFT